MTGFSEKEKSILEDNGFLVNNAVATNTINNWEVYFFKKEHGKHSLYNVSYIAQKDTSEFSKGELAVFESNKSEYASSPKTVSFMIEELVPYFNNKSV